MMALSFPALILTSLLAGQPASPESNPLVSCGPAAIYFLLDRLGDSVPLEQIQRRVPAHEDEQNSLDELQAALRQLGYPEAAGYRLTPEQLRRLDGPAISYTNIPGKDGEPLGHFVVIEPRGDRLLVVDSLYAPRLISLKEHVKDGEVRVLVARPAQQLRAVRQRDAAGLGLTVLLVILAAVLVSGAGFYLRRGLPWQAKTQASTA